MNHVLFAHQSAELYGSDKVLIYLLDGLVVSGVKPIVLLPSDGPLLAVLRSRGHEVHIVPLVKVARSTFGAYGMLNLIIGLISSIRAINRVTRSRRIVAVYTNTVAVLGAGIWARLHKVPHLWHVHEIILRPAAARRLFPILLRVLSDKVICNSNMTLQWVVSEQPKLRMRSCVIWNGQPKRPPIDVDAVDLIRARLCIKHDEVVVALVGRVNRWKGQSVLIDAASLLWERGFRNIRFLIVGGGALGSDGQIAVNAMLDRIATSPAKRLISWLDFTDDIWPVWDLCDIAVIPSTDPEPFGMVAIEAMASSRPVLASSHGGLLDIVEDGITGMLLEPNSPSDLADAIAKLVSSTDLRQQMGRAGELRQSHIFSIEAQVAATRSCLVELSNEVV